MIDKGSKENTIRIHTATKKAVEKEGATVESWHCACLELGAIASGEANVFVHCGLNSWDIAAGIAIVESAGGVVNHLNGDKKDLSAPGTVASNPALQKKILEITKNI